MGFGAGAVGAAATAVLHFTYPAAAKAGCPSCYGFTDLGDGVYVEGDMSPDRRAAAKATIETARARVREFYGDLRSSPRVLLCATEACYRPLGGGSRGVTLLDRALILSPRGADTVIAAHELAHADFRREVAQAFGREHHRVVEHLLQVFARLETVG